MLFTSRVIHPLRFQPAFAIVIAGLFGGASSLATSLVARDNDTQLRVALDPVQNMCQRWYHQSTYKNGTLYVVGGLETYAPYDPANNKIIWSDITNGYNEAIIAIDMTQPWDWKTNISEVATNITADPNPNTGTIPPIVNNGALYSGGSGSSDIYLYGGTSSSWNTSFPGYQGPTSAQYVLWSYDTNDAVWEQYDISDGSPLRPNYGFGAEASDLELAFYLNGKVDNGSAISPLQINNGTELALQGLIVIDTSSQRAKNLSTSEYNGEGRRTGGGMVYISNYGAHGILVAIGGISNTSDTESEYISMDEISIYDVDAYYNKKESYSGWFKQNATGDKIPEPRIDFCVVAVSAPDNSSHSIYLYGGRGAKNANFDDIYVLSIPTFTWTLLFTGQSPRYGHTCHLVGRSTMITVGGFSPWNPCDWEARGVAVFDMSGLVWGSVFAPDDEPYSLPSKVNSTVTGGTGRTALTQPSQGYTEPQLAELMNGTAAVTATPTPAPSPHHINVGAIVGGVIGGLVAVSIVLFVVIWRWRKGRGRQQGRPLAEADGVERYEKDGDSPVKEMEASTPRLELPAIEPVHELPGRQSTWTDMNAALGSSTDGRK